MNKWVRRNRGIGEIGKVMVVNGERGEKGGRQRVL